MLYFFYLVIECTGRMLLDPLGFVCILYFVLATFISSLLVLAAVLQHSDLSEESLLVYGISFRKAIEEK